MSQRMKIVHSCETAMGGVGVYQKTLSRMDPARFEQIFHLPAPHAEIMGGDPRVVTFPMRGRGLRAIFEQTRSLRRLLRAERPDVLFLHSSFSLLPLLALRLTGDLPRTLYCAHGWASVQYKGLKGRLVRAAEGRLCGLADLVVNVSVNDLELARSARFCGAHVMIENGVPDRTAGPRRDLFARDDGKLNLLFVGRFDRQKGVDILAAACARLGARRPDLKLHVIGAAVRGDDVPDLPKDVHCAGWVGGDEIDDWYASADAVVVPSRWEGLPLVIPEALRNGTPVIVSRRSGMAGLIEEGRTGLSFPLETEALAQCLEGLDRAQLRAMRPACRALYERRYSMRRMFDEIAKAYVAPVALARAVRRGPNGVAIGD
ncbi:hypothetical protein DL1_09130 [Thioclava dalianensis]|uniref:Glycosyltransferase subfamily 4-like N-terminal domain-containing protein n=1 Tax=Thioclava dalianensis TaxID=1185766 RepID=A0A074U280_9RHOB|nr:glycosyltransferase [Thioclava dalianensis]KEP68737.1 hypothetical protein DL1_09130 [Thioclava dalianensis]SFN59361.1 Glycosyltransferase involved in cell wall bisynthesis [Thioclava dalianensis]